MEASLELARIIQPLEPSKAALVREGFEAMFSKVDEWQTEAQSLLVTAEDQVGKMKRAGLLRKEIKAARVGLDKRRKEMKAGILLEGKAIDGAFAVFESLSSPLEKHLLEQEEFAKRAEAVRKDLVRSARAEALQALGAWEPAALGEMSEEAWLEVLRDAKAAKEAREEKARLEEEARVEAARIVAEKEAVRRAEAVKMEAERLEREKLQAEEVERLKALAEKVAEEQRVERVKVEEEKRKTEELHRAEREADRILAEAAKAEEQRATEALRVELAKKAAPVVPMPPATISAAPLPGVSLPGVPTRAKYSALLKFVRRIAMEPSDFDAPMASAWAREVLEEIGEL